MNSIIFKVCGKKEEIIEQLDENIPYLNYELFSEGIDCKLILKDIAEKDLELVVNLLSDIIYLDEDMTLAEYVIRLLYDNNISIAIAESCTGGMISSMLVDVPGSSEVFYEGVVTYSNISKMNRLSVSEDTISEFGAVSPETSLEMAQGLLNDNVIIGVSTTGIAGPHGGSDDKPVGTVYITVANLENFCTYKYLFAGSRNEIRKQASQKALFHIIEFLIRNYRIS